MAKKKSKEANHKLQVEYFSEIEVKYTKIEFRRFANGAKETFSNFKIVTIITVIILTVAWLVFPITKLKSGTFSSIYAGIIIGGSILIISLYFLPAFSLIILPALNFIITLVRHLIQLPFIILNMVIDFTIDYYNDKLK